MPDPGNQRLDLYLPNYQLSIGQKLEFCMIHISKIKSNVNQEHLHLVLKLDPPRMKTKVDKNASGLTMINF